MVWRTEKRPGCQGLNAPQRNVVPTSPDLYSLTYLYILNDVARDRRLLLVLLEVINNIEWDVIVDLP